MSWDYNHIGREDAIGFDHSSVGPTDTPPSISFPQFNHLICGAIGYSDPGELVILPLDVSMNKERYIELLRNHLNKSFRMCRDHRRRAILQQDGATCHTIKVVGKYLDSNNIS